ncbi:histidine kinase, partial [Vibrio xuii]
QQQKIAHLSEEYDVDFMNEDLEPLLQDTIEGTERMRDIVKGLKEFSHVDTSENYSLCDLNECIKSTLKMASNELKYHCDIKLELGELPLTYCCAGQINQVLLNLLLNAGHAIEDQGTITICSKQNGDRLELSVTDTGRGITEEDKGKLFDPFFTTKAVGKGAGLG